MCNWLDLHLKHSETVRNRYQWIRGNSFSIPAASIRFLFLFHTVANVTICLCHICAMRLLGRFSVEQRDGLTPDLRTEMGVAHGDSDVGVTGVLLDNLERDAKHNQV